MIYFLDQSAFLLKIYEAETVFWISEFKMADADRMAAVLEASKSGKMKKKLFITYLLVCMHLLTTFITAESLTVIMGKS